MAFSKETECSLLQNLREFRGGLPQGYLHTWSQALPHIQQAPHRVQPEVTYSHSSVEGQARLALPAQVVWSLRHVPTNVIC